MVFENLCTLVLWTKVALALEGLSVGAANLCDFLGVGSANLIDFFLHVDVGGGEPLRLELALVLLHRCLDG